jgi:hypothetical protein
MSQPLTATELREARRKEYGTYVALGPIDVHGVRAFNEGDPVPVAHVEQSAAGCPSCETAGVADEPHVASHLVAKVTTKAGREAAGVTTPTENPKG